MKDWMLQIHRRISVLIHFVRLSDNAERCMIRDGSSVALMFPMLAK